MEVIETGLEGLVELQPRVFNDDRGWFMETYNESRYKGLIADYHPFVQDNLSQSAVHTLRGIHFQSPPFAQSKLVMVLNGRALDVAVDLRKDSPTYGEHRTVILDSNTKNQLYIPRGFGHGFLALEEGTQFYYKCDNVYNKESEMTLSWNDSDLGINWMVDHPLISEKDGQGLSFKDFNSPFGR